MISHIIPASSSTNGTNIPASSSSNSNNQQADNASALPRAANGCPPLPPSSPATLFREQDHHMPIANVIRVMRRILPSYAKIADEAKETIQECVSEFISFVTEEANDRCHKEQRKIITADDLIWAMARLGFDNYVEPLFLYLQRYRELEGGASHHRASWMQLMRPMPVVASTMMVRPSMEGPKSHAGVRFGISHGSASTTAKTAIAIATTTPENIGDGGGGSGDDGFNPINSKSFDVGSCSNDDLLGFDAFDLPLIVASPSTAASNNTSKGAAQEVENLDHFAQFK